MSRRVDKPWGYEDIWAEGTRYVGKILSIAGGKRLSLQYHQVKDETILVLRGRLRLELENERGELEVLELAAGQSRHIAPGRRHRFGAVDDCELVEVSTPELDDVVRVEDDFGRAPR
jgi:mannose-6-phosphate isomerase